MSFFYWTSVRSVRSVRAWSGTEPRCDQTALNRRSGLWGPARTRTEDW